MPYNLKPNEKIFLNKLKSNPYHIFTYTEGLWIISKFSKNNKTIHIIGKMTIKSKKSRNPIITIIQITKACELFF